MREMISFVSRGWLSCCLSHCGIYSYKTIFKHAEDQAAQNYFLKADLEAICKIESPTNG